LKKVFPVLKSWWMQNLQGFTTGMPIQKFDALGEYEEA
jgi:hypothetical protein